MLVRSAAYAAQAQPPMLVTRCLCQFTCLLKHDVIVEDLGRNLAGGQHPTHLCHHATRFLHTKAETYELFRTNFGCPEEDGSLAASRSVSRCCSRGITRLGQLTAVSDMAAQLRAYQHEWERHAAGSAS